MGFSGGSHFESATGHPDHQIGPILVRTSNIWNDPSEVPSNVKYSVDRFNQLKESEAIANDDHCAVDRGCVLFNDDLLPGEGREGITVHQHSSRLLVEFY